MSSLVQEVYQDRTFNIMLSIYQTNSYSGPPKEKVMHLIEGMPEYIARLIVSNGDRILNKHERYSLYLPGGKLKETNRIDISPYPNKDIVIFTEITDDTEKYYQYNFALSFSDMHELVEHLSLALDQPKMYKNVIFK